MLEHPWITKSYKIQTNAQLDREILSSLKGFDQKNLLQKEILFVMARISKENEIQKLYHQPLSAKKKSFGLCFNISIEKTLDISQVIL